MSLGYAIAIQDLDPKFGRVHMEQVFWKANNERTKVPLKLVDCAELETSLKPSELSPSHEALFESLKMSRRAKDISYLCPAVENESLLLQGHYNAEQFDYVAIKILGCDLGEDQCAPDEEISSEVINVMSTKALPTIGEDNFHGMVTYTVG